MFTSFFIECPLSFMNRTLQAQFNLFLVTEGHNLWGWVTVLDYKIILSLIDGSRVSGPSSSQMLQGCSSTELGRGRSCSLSRTINICMAASPHAQQPCPVAASWVVALQLPLGALSVPSGSFQQLSHALLLPSSLFLLLLLTAFTALYLPISWL